ncbi:hypothetical protein V8G54_017641, partial [Vigna mungo]
LITSDFLCCLLTPLLPFLVCCLVGFFDFLTNPELPLSEAGLEFAGFFLRSSLNVDPRLFFWSVSFFDCSVLTGVSGLESVSNGSGFTISVSVMDEEQQCTSSPEDRVPSSSTCEMLSETWLCSIFSAMR